ncbi:hypothetical protein KIY71_gp32 [Mycobacterium phage Cintron]|uniref:Uncharacterized protein n=1 Tax=Mycobacterium phage Cintron TaxID=2686232 RepID=A0A6B9L7Z1_9CAUD|nr:hypothetical protein KIY71_gp32 [Mycobacterium phage Cintron]QHB37972.1 hypothetical protein SEA_CINTRON_32 [Mycobacterium phage Cintron]
MPYPYPVPPKRKPAPNPLFLTLAILSGFPSAFFLLLFVSGATSILVAGGFIWSAMWVWVWWAMADRYR